MTDDKPVVLGGFDGPTAGGFTSGWAMSAAVRELRDTAGYDVAPRSRRRLAKMIEEMRAWAETTSDRWDRFTRNIEASRTRLSADDSRAYQRAKFFTDRLIDTNPYKDDLIRMVELANAHLNAEAKEPPA